MSCQIVEYSVTTKDKSRNPVYVRPRRAQVGCSSGYAKEEKIENTKLDMATDHMGLLKCCKLLLKIEQNNKLPKMALEKMTW